MTLSCFELGERMLSVQEALVAVRQLVPEPLPAQSVALVELPGRVLAQAIHSPIAVPQNTNAAMDGIALAWPDEEALRPATWPLAGEVLAGHSYGARLPTGEAVRITTGAPLPEGADTVIMSEQLETLESDTGTRVRVARAERVKRGQNVRQAGEDVAQGSLALPAGSRLKPQHLGLLASLGLAQAQVHRRPRVTIFSTGDEVTAPGEPLPSAGIFDANRFSLRGLLTGLGVELIDLGILPDDHQQLVQALERAAQESDMVITSGGVSVGQADWVKRALAEVGDLGFWRIAIRPGRPLACGRLGARQVPFFGLPGNPVAVMVTFLQFVQPVLRQLQGETHWQPMRLTALAEEALPSRQGRVDLLRGIFHGDDQGRLWVRSTGHQGSGILSSMVAANCLIEIDAERDGVTMGESVTLQPFDSLT
ncbi:MULTISPECIES: gephyrin-like molybdotransferase Glp [Halomonadaceae]|uniref:molybdopterin molybdotransferase MoeA n=1 Tax=Halomonadaceae TaxID=28256 RepID=UPI0015971B65|nr:MULTISPECIES: gephyrin-like molybdotransferase Glp [Halomonas]QJQ94455.1 molybdopterin molybdenumtransferase MoeA [Halomonas sp. PA5]